MTRLHNSRFDLLKIPFVGKNVSNEFILLKIDSSGNFSKGLIISITGKTTGIDNRYSYNGHINIDFLNRVNKISSIIVDGVISEYHKTSIAYRSLAEPILPEVIVTCYIHSSSDFTTYSDWINLMGLFGNYSGSSGYYSNMNGSITGSGSNNYSGGGSSGTGGNNSGGGIAEDNTAFIDFEVLSDVAIDINEYLKCFSSIPNNGASCSVEILTDIPVDNDPNKFFDWSNGSPGHTFLHLTKSNGDKTVSQYLGFYPKYGWKTLLTASTIEGKFDDNGTHEFNASLKRDVKPEEFIGIISKIETLAKNIKYDIDNYNCTDFALDVFNSIPNTNPIAIRKFNIPIGEYRNKTSTPQGVYQKLKSMKDANIEGLNINIPTSKAYAGESSGPCN